MYKYITHGYEHVAALNQHLFSKNIIDSPVCTCGAVEDTYHYLFVCNRFSNLRQELFNTVSIICQPTLNVLLFGNDEPSTLQNSYLFLAVQNFVLKTKRFQISSPYLLFVDSNFRSRLYIVFFFFLSLTFICINLCI